MLILKDHCGIYLESPEQAQSFALPEDAEVVISFQGVCSLTPTFATVLLQRIYEAKASRPEQKFRLTGWTVAQRKTVEMSRQALR